MLQIARYENIYDHVCGQGFFYVYDKECWYSERSGFVPRSHMLRVLNLAIKRREDWKHKTAHEWLCEMESSDLMRISYGKLRDYHMEGFIWTPWKFMMRDTGGYRSTKPCEIRDYHYLGGCIR